MMIPLQISFRHIDPSPALESRIRAEATKLEQFHENIISCRVVVEAPHRHQHKGKLYNLRIDLKAPGKELVVTKQQHDKHAHEDIYVVIRDAFNAMRRQLEDHAKIQHRRIKAHEIPAHGRVLQLIPIQDYGMIKTPDGREIYFHRNSVLNDEYDNLSEGDEVRFVEEAGDEGPQASTVTQLGKHHIVG
jgi:ribosomal subunit interface protein